MLQCVCCWEDRDKMFKEVEGIIKRQINVRSNPFTTLFFFFKILNQYMIWYMHTCFNVLQLLCFSVRQMSVLPSVQPFHAIAYPLDPLIALEIRYGCSGN